MVWCMVANGCGGVTTDSGQMKVKKAIETIEKKRDPMSIKPYATALSVSQACMKTGLGFRRRARVSADY